MTDPSKRVGGVTPPPSTQQFDEKVLNAIRVLAPVLVPRIASSIGAFEDETSASVCRLVAKGQVRVLHLGYLAPRDYETVDPGVWRVIEGKARNQEGRDDYRRRMEARWDHDGDPANEAWRH